MEDALEQMLRKGLEEDGPGKLFGLKVVEVGKERMTAEFTVMGGRPGRIPRRASWSGTRAFLEIPRRSRNPS